MGRSPRTRHVLPAFTARPVAAQPQRPATPDRPGCVVGDLRDDIERVTGVRPGARGTRCRTVPSQAPGKGPRLEYDMTLTTTGPVKVGAYPSAEGLRYAASIDGAEPQVVNIIEATGANATTMNEQWERNTSDNVDRTVTTHTITGPGVHTLQFRMIDPTVVLQKVVVDAGGLRASCLGPPESRRAGFRPTPTPQGGTKP